MKIDWGERPRYLGWLAGALQAHGLEATVVGTSVNVVLRVGVPGAGRVRFVVCVPVPQAGRWAWVWPFGWAMVDDPRAVAMILEAMRR